MFNISVDWPKIALANIRIIMHNRTLEFVDPVPFLCTNYKNLVLAKRVLSQKRRKMYLQIIVTSFIKIPLYIEM